MKESIFDILGSMGGVDGLRVVDLFCGSGALGIEALSRGAAHVTFVDADRDALAAAAANLEAVGLDQAAVTLTRASLPGWTVPEVDLVLMDPPYDMADPEAVLSSVRAEVVVLESRREPQIPEGWVVHRQRRYGSTLVTVLTTDISGEAS